MFERASLRQHVTTEGVEVPRSKRQARATATIGVQLPRGESAGAEFYCVMTLERGAGEDPAYVTVDRAMISTVIDGMEFVVTPGQNMPVMTKIGDRTFLIGADEIIVIDERGAARLILKEDGHIEIENVSDAQVKPGNVADD